MGDVTARLGRLAEYGLLQRKVVAGGLPGYGHLAISSGFAVLFAGSVLVQVDAYLLRPRGIALLQGRADQVVQATLDAFGLVFVAGLGLALHRRLRTRPAHFEARLESLLVLLSLLCLGVTGFLLEGLRLALEARPSGPSAFAGYALSHLIRPRLAPHAGFVAYRALWWSHAVLAFGLLAAIPYTRLIHMILSPLNILVSSPRPRPDLRAPFDLRELIGTGNFDVKVGAGRIGDFGWTDRVGLAACTGCGRCEEACPAHATGTALSPRRLVEKLSGELRRAGGHRGPRDLLAGVVSADEVWACTMCGACSGACPVLIHPPTYVAELRRELVSRNRLDRKQTELLDNLGRSFNPFGFPHAEREAVTRRLGVPALSESRDVECVYWVGCAGAYDPRVGRVVQAVLRILTAAGVRFAVLGGEERCVGDPARRLGEEGRFQELALHNLGLLQRHGVTKVVTHCPHCFSTLTREYAQLGGRVDAVHHSVFIRELLDQGRLALRPGPATSVTLHDSCYLGRLNGEYEAPRAVLGAVPGLRLVDMRRARETSWCCGAGGANYWYEVPRAIKMSTVRVREAAETGVGVLAVECPFCLRMLEEAATAERREGALPVRDLAEIVAAALAPTPTG